MVAVGSDLVAQFSHIEGYGRSYSLEILSSLLSYLVAPWVNPAHHVHASMEFPNKFVLLEEPFLKG